MLVRPLFYQKSHSSWRKSDRLLVQQMAIDLSLIAEQAEQTTEAARKAKTELDNTLSHLAQYQPPEPTIYEAPIWPMLLVSILIGGTLAVSESLLFKFQTLPPLLQKIEALSQQVEKNDQVLYKQLLSPKNTPQK